MIGVPRSKSPYSSAVIKSFSVWHNDRRVFWIFYVCFVFRFISRRLLSTINFQTRDSCRIDYTRIISLKSQNTTMLNVTICIRICPANEECRIMWHEGEGNGQQYETNVTRNIVFFFFHNRISLFSTFATLETGHKCNRPDFILMKTHDFGYLDIKVFTLRINIPTDGLYHFVDIIHGKLYAINFYKGYSRGNTFC